MNELTRTRASSFDYRNLLFILFAFGFAAFTVLASYFGLTYLYDPDYIVLFVALIIGVGISLVGEIIFAVSINKKKAMGAYLRLCAWLPLVVVGSMAFGVILTYLVSKYAFTSLPEAAQGHQVYYFAALFVGAVVSMIPTLICIRPENKPVQVAPRNGFAKFINGALPWFLVIYTALVILPWMAHPSESLFTLLNESKFASFYRYGLSGFFIVYMLLIVIANKKLPSIPYTVLFGLMMVYLLLLTFIVPRSLAVTSINKIDVEYSITFKESFLFYLRYCYALFNCYSLLFILPLAGKPKHFRNLLCYFVILFSIICILYSSIAEKDKFLAIFSNEDVNKYTDTMSSFFETKNGFGGVLFGGFLCSLLLAVDYKRGFFKAIFILIGLLFVALTYFIRCDTAFVSCAAVLAVWVFFVLFHLFHKQRVLSIVGLSIICVLFIGGLVAIFQPDIYSKVPFLASLNSDINKAFIYGRLQIVWDPYYSTIDPNTLFFGEGLMGRYSSFMVYYGQVFSFPFHNGYIELFNAGGIVLVSFYLFVVFILLKKLAQIRKTNSYVFGVVLSALFGFMVYALAESITLTIDTSLMSLIPSLIIAIAPTFYQKDSAYQSDVSI
jgi:hypothetical protein